MNQYDITWWFISNINYIYSAMLILALSYYLWRKSKYKYRVAIFRCPDGKVKYRAEYRKSLFSPWVSEHMGIVSADVDTKLAAYDVIETWKLYESRGRSMKWNKYSKTSHDYYK